MTGYLMLNGRLAGADLIARISGFVPQEDLSIEDLTVDEHMEFMARLMMDRRCMKQARNRRIQYLLGDLGITTCTRTKLKDLSGGERKRVALAVQLLNDPPILFCDEPTTGLDSWGAAAVVARLRKLAIGGKLVICSVHQPASGVFELFHQVVLLANGRTALNFKCPLGFNAAEYYVSLLGIELDKEADSRERIRKICDEYQRSDIASDIDSRVGDVQDEMEVKVNYFVQFYWLMWRNIQSVKHNSTIWIAEFLLLMRDIQNVQGLLYLTITETIFLFIYAVFITFPSEIPRAVIEPILFASLVFGVAGLRGGFIGWMWFCIVCVLCANYANAYGSFLSSVFNSMETAALFSVPFELIGTMFSGLYLNLGSLNHYVSWLRFLSPFYYGVESISILQWDSIESINCVKIAGMPCLSTGPEVLDRYGFAEAHFWRNLSSLAIMYCIAHTIAYVMVIKRSRGTPVY
ncbi:Bm-ok protein [Operophtera brumata]|uniref:Bm-ok protein n=1 Tax=Operophtera brumata TaxID=104452 RepID=A0A0L7KSB8_OPEBR|nr:Bm-ok protein [Operophtera brumata]